MEQIKNHSTAWRGGIAKNITFIVTRTANWLANTVISLAKIQKKEWLLT